MTRFYSIGLGWLAAVLLPLGTALAHADQAAPAATVHPSASTPTAATKVPKRKPRPFTELVQKANGVNAQLRYRIENTPAAFQSVTITMQIEAGDEPVQYTVEVEPPLQLRASSGDGLAHANRTSTVNVVVVPPADGLYYLNVFLKQGERQSVHSIAVQAGKRNASPASNLKTEPNGERVIVMPAR